MTDVDRRRLPSIHSAARRARSAYVHSQLVRLIAWLKPRRVGHRALPYH